MLIGQVHQAAWPWILLPVVEEHATNIFVADDLLAVVFKENLAASPTASRFKREFEPVVRQDHLFGRFDRGVRADRSWSPVCAFFDSTTP